MHSHFCIPTPSLTVDALSSPNNAAIAVHGEENASVGLVAASRSTCPILRTFPFEEMRSRTTGSRCSVPRDNDPRVECIGERRGKIAVLICIRLPFEGVVHVLWLHCGAARYVTIAVPAVGV